MVQRKRVVKTEEKAAKPTAPVVQDARIWWINTGGIFITATGNTIKSGEKFKARVEDIPKASRDIVKPLEPITESPTLQVAVPNYALQQCEDTDDDPMFNIVDSRGKIINESPLDEEAANALLKRLQD